MISAIRQNPEPGTTRRRLFPALAVLSLLFWLMCGIALSAMNLMDEDSLSDVQAQTGLSLVARVRTTGGNLRVTGTGYLDLGNVTINNGNANNFGRIGDYDDPAILDIGRSGTSVRMQLTFPNGMNGATESLEVPSIQAGTVLWTDSTSPTPVPVNVGTLAINQIYQNRMRWTAWFHQTGLNLLLELNGDITDIRIDPPGDGTGGGVSLQNTLFSLYGNSNTTPGQADGYFTFGGATGMAIDIYTAEKVWAAGEQGFFTNPGTVDGRNRSLMRISYPVTGSFRIRNGRIQDAVTDVWNNYGPIIMENMTGGEVTIEFPHSTGTGVLFFNPDV